MSSGSDPRLACLVILLRCHGVAAEPEQIRHRIGSKVNVADMLRFSKELGLKARVSTTSCGEGRSECSSK
jgi:subfamily B ATP-binding cassette protein HlyB/CyaB